MDIVDIQNLYIVEDSTNWFEDTNVKYDMEVKSVCFLVTKILISPL